MSFKERLELITVPYLLDFPAESQIYWEQLRSLSEEINIGPHVPDVLALWAVLCRLERAHGWEPLDEETVKGLQAMSAVDKANLYAYGILPPSLSRESANSLRNAIPTLFSERLNDEHYEGRFGPSPRELKGVLLSAARFSPDSLTGVEILSALHELTQQTAVYPFLSLEPTKIITILSWRSLQYINGILVLLKTNCTKQWVWLTRARPLNC